MGVRKNTPVKPLRNPLHVITEKTVPPNPSGSGIHTRKHRQTPEGTRKTPGNHPHRPLKQNSSYSVAEQQQNNTERTQKNPPNNKTTEKTTPPTLPQNRGGYSHSRDTPNPLIGNIKTPTPQTTTCPPTTHHADGPR